MIAGVEVSTDRGHVLALAPGDNGLTVLDELCERVPVSKVETASFDQLTSALNQRRRSGDNSLFRNNVVVVGAHADRPGSLLGGNQTHSVNDQIQSARCLQALEIVSDERLSEWKRGVKQTDFTTALLRGSDYHPLGEYNPRSTWIFLPEVNAQSFQHAFATHEASIVANNPPPNEPEFWIKSIRFEGGPTTAVKSLFLRGPTRSSGRLRPGNR